MFFGWDFKQFGQQPYWLAVTGPEERQGINGAIMKKRDSRQLITSYIEVDDLPATLGQIEKNGGKVVVAMTAVPRVGWLAYFQDPDGNMIGLMQNDPDAQ